MDLSPATEAIVTPLSFGRYQVCTLLGEGAMGRVYLAEDPVLARKVAIKVIAVDKHTEPRTKDEYLHRFTLEARACARLNHPSIVTVYDAGEQHGIPWIAFEYVNGEQLENMLKKRVPLSLDRILSILLDITSALHHAHDCGIIHRDIKPANILVDTQASITKLADFGIVKAPWIALTQDGSAVGSPGYMSPEQLNGSGVDARSDLFSLGIVTYQMLTGEHPFLRDTIAATIFATLHGDYHAITNYRPEAPPYLNTIVTTLLAADPAQRFQTAAMLLHELRSGSGRPVADGAHIVPTTKQNAFNDIKITSRSQEIHAFRFSPSAILASIRVLTSVLYNRIAVLGIHCSMAIKKVFRSILHRNILQSVFAVTTVLLLGVILYMVPRTVKNRTINDQTILDTLHQEGFSGTFKTIIDSCKTMIDSSRFDAVIASAKKISATNKYAIYGDLLQCRVALVEGRDDDAIPLVTSLCSRKEWRTIKNKELPAIIDNCKIRLTRKKADTSLTSVLATTLFSDNRDYIIEWIYRSDYWLRWNSVRIAAQLQIPVDSVMLYILDLQYGGSVRTRTHAATRLGELGDARAIVPLTRAAHLGLRDPIVSYTADLVLNNYFNNINDTVVSNPSHPHNTISVPSVKKHER